MKCSVVFNDSNQMDFCSLAFVSVYSKRNLKKKKINKKMPKSKFLFGLSVPAIMFSKC